MTTPGTPSPPEGPAGSGGGPWLRVVRGEPDDAELAAVVAAVAALTAAAEAAAEPRRSAWADPDRMHRHPIHAGAPGHWRLSGQLPRV